MTWQFPLFPYSYQSWLEILRPLSELFPWKPIGTMPTATWFIFAEIHEYFNCNWGIIIGNIYPCTCLSEWAMLPWQASWMRLKWMYVNSWKYKLLPPSGHRSILILNSSLFVSSSPPQMLLFDVPIHNSVQINTTCIEVNWHVLDMKHFPSHFKYQRFDCFYLYVKRIGISEVFWKWKSKHLVENSDGLYIY